MTLTTTKTVRDLALNLPGVTWVFAKLGIDCSRGGGKELREACQNARVAEEKVVALEEASRDATLPDDERDWNRAPLSDLTTHIVTKHHKFTREELPRLIQLHVKVCSVHSTNHPELVRIHSILHELQQELMSHMLKEEQVLFPYIEQLEEAANRGEHAPTTFPCGTLRNPIGSMRHEHEEAGHCVACVSAPPTMPFLRMLASVSEHFIRRLNTSRKTCISTFVSRTTSCFHGPRNCGHRHPGL